MDINSVGSESGDPVYMTYRQIARRVGVPAGWIEKQAKAGLIPHIVAGKQRRYKLADVLAAVDAMKTGGGK